MSIEEKDWSRREFLRTVGIFTIGVSGIGFQAYRPPKASAEKESPLTPSMGYILVDSRICQGCASCMIACSLVNEGCVNLSLARIQVLQDPFRAWPGDIQLSQCRQCLDPQCVEACPEDALTIDRGHGDIRRIDKEKCIGCGQCMEACPFEPSRSFLMPDPSLGGDLISRKCDLCLSAPYHWDPDGGGINGKKACESVCPVGAIQFTTTMPVQEGDTGYDVNLRKSMWERWLRPGS